MQKNKFIVLSISITPIPFLANLGKMGREFHRCFEGDTTDTKESYVEVIGTSLLQAIQRDLLQGGAEDVLPLAPDDSVQVFSASSKIKEVEMLQKTIQKLLNDNSSLSPEDVAVYVPDIEEYLSSIHWVFGKDDAPYDYTIYDIPADLEDIWNFFALV